MCLNRRRSVVLGATLLTAITLPALAAGDLHGLDANHDGQVSRDEAADAQASTFAKLDSNHDGSLSQSEWVASQAPLPEDATKAAKHRQQAAWQRWFENMDSDGDGAISQDEYLHAVAPYFDRLDANHDGVLDAGELQAAVAKPSADSGETPQADGH